KLTSTNRPFGLIIKLSQTVFGKEQSQKCTVRSISSRTCNASQICCHARCVSSVINRISAASKKFLVVIPRGSHPFPSRTRKLSLAGPMILHGQLCGNVGHRQNLYYKRPL